MGGEPRAQNSWGGVAKPVEAWVEALRGLRAHSESRLAGLIDRHLPDLFAQHDGRRGRRYHGAGLGMGIPRAYQGPAAQRCQIPLPDTILFKDAEPCRWVFTAKTGHVMSRSGNKLKLAKIKRRFMDRHHIEGDDIEDRRVRVCRKAGGGGVDVQLLTAAELTELCSDAGSRGGIVALQDFIEASRLTTFKCKYQRTDDYGGQTKGFKFETHKVNEVSAETLKILNGCGQG